jgi:hypothetical protein
VSSDASRKSIEVGEMYVQQRGDGRGDQAADVFAQRDVTPDGGREFSDVSGIGH